MERQRPRIASVVLNKVRGLMLPYFETYYRAIGIKTVVSVGEYAYRNGTE